MAFTTHSTVILEAVREKPVQQGRCAWKSRGRVPHRCQSKAYGEEKPDSAHHGVRPARQRSQLGCIRRSVFRRRTGKMAHQGNPQRDLPSLLSKVSLIEEPFGCGQLLRLYEQDFQYLKDRIIVLDGDVSEEETNSKVSGRKLKSGKPDKAPRNRQAGKHHMELPERSAGERSRMGCPCAV